MFRAEAPPAAANEHEVWSEPGLMPGSTPPAAAVTYAGLIGARWQAASVPGSWGLTALLIAIAAPLAVLAAVVKAGSMSVLAAVVIMAPLVEELGKALAPLMVLERQPYRFTSAAQPLLVCVCSGLFFALIENLLYFHIFNRTPSAMLVAWRRTVCVAIHVGCSGIVGLGLRRVWLEARAARAMADISLAAPYLIAAMVIHGLYNAFAFLIESTGIISFL